jgi:AcrR family transcriptional regulator
MFLVNNTVILAGEKKYMQTYSAMRDQNQEALRRTVVAAAEQILVDQGAEAVTVRRVAQQLDCSTTVIYNLFGSKDGLANELYQAGCRILHAVLAGVTPRDQPAPYLRDLAWAYWDFAHQNPQYYTFMFSGALPQFKPDPTSIQDVATAIGLLVAVLERYRAQGLLITDDTAQTATMLWAALHGVIQLGFAGHLGVPTVAHAIYIRTATTLIDALLVA